MEFLPIAFLAGILTALAPCVLPVLPIVIGGSVGGGGYTRPLVITLSLGASIVLFTLLLKASTLLIDIPQSVWQITSGVIILFFGITALFPDVWEKIQTKLGLGSSSQKLLSKAGTKKGFFGMVLMGGALGPVFASCSPVYFVILGTVLPADFFTGLINLIAYGLGLSAIMFVIGFFGQKAVARLRFAADAHGLFRRGLGVLFLLIGVAIMLGYDKKLEVYLLQNELYFDTSGLENQLIEKAQK